MDKYFAPTVSCSAPVVPTDAHISNQSASVYLEGTKVTFQCDNVSHAVLTTMCHANGNWCPPPSELACNPSGIYINYHNSSLLNYAITIIPLTANVKKVLSNSSQVILAAFICSFVFFLLGVLVGALCHRWARVFIKPCNIKHSLNGTVHKHPPPTDTQAAAAPIVYEEVTSDSPPGQKIELKENVAYGPI